MKTMLEGKKALEACPALCDDKEGLNLFRVPKN